jgi:broad specificity phosphatase PhoE
MPLADSLKRHVPAHIVSSEEGKAVETAQIVAGQLGLSVEVLGGLQEHDRTGVLYRPNEDEFQRDVAQFFANPEKLVMGRETAMEAKERFADALESALARYKEGNVAVVAHGTVISLFVADRAGLEPYDYWEQLGIPSFTVLSIPEFRLLTTVDRIR